MISNDIVKSVIDLVSKKRLAAKKIRAFSQRKDFFESILLAIKEKPDKAAILFGQDELLNSSRVFDECIDTNHGILIFSIECKCFEEVSHHTYSLFLTGDIFRIGLLLSGKLERAPLIDWQNEMNDLWPGTLPVHHNRKNLSLYEWTFAVPDVYDNYITQERYIFGMRHMQCRILRIVNDLFALIAAGSDNEKEKAQILK